MNDHKLAGDALCQALMHEVSRTIRAGARTQIGYLRHGVRTRVEQHLGKDILALAPAGLAPEQLDALEAALCRLQEDMMGSFFSLIDGSSQPPGFPDKIRLVNMDTGEEICPGRLEWAFGLALAEQKAQE